MREKSPKIIRSVTTMHKVMGISRYRIAIEMRRAYKISKEHVYNVMKLKTQPSVGTALLFHDYLRSKGYAYKDVFQFFHLRMVKKISKK